MFYLDFNKRVGTECSGANLLESEECKYPSESTMVLCFDSVELAKFIFVSRS